MFDSDSLPDLKPVSSHVLPGSRSALAITTSSDGSVYAVSHGDASVRVFSSSIGGPTEQLAVLHGHARTPFLCAFHPFHADILVTGSPSASSPTGPTPASAPSSSSSSSPSPPAPPAPTLPSPAVAPAAAAPSSTAEQASAQANRAQLILWHWPSGRALAFATLRADSSSSSSSSSASTAAGQGVQGVAGHRSSSMCGAWSPCGSTVLFAVGTSLYAWVLRAGSLGVSALAGAAQQQEGEEEGEGAGDAAKLSDEYSRSVRALRSRTTALLQAALNRLHLVSAGEVPQQALWQTGCGRGPVHTDGVAGAVQACVELAPDVSLRHAVLSAPAPLLHIPPAYYRCVRALLVSPCGASLFAACELRQGEEEPVGPRDYGGATAGASPTTSGTPLCTVLAWALDVPCLHAAVDTYERDTRAWVQANKAAGGLGGTRAGRAGSATAAVHSVHPSLPSSAPGGVPPLQQGVEQVREGSHRAGVVPDSAAPQLQQVVTDAHRWGSFTGSLMMALPSTDSPAGAGGAGGGGASSKGGASRSSKGKSDASPPSVTTSSVGLSLPFKGLTWPSPFKSMTTMWGGGGGSGGSTAHSTGNAQAAVPGPQPIVGDTSPLSTSSGSQDLSTSAGTARDRTPSTVSSMSAATSIAQLTSALGQAHVHAGAGVSVNGSKAEGSFAAASIAHPSSSPVDCPQWAAVHYTRRPWAQPLLPHWLALHAAPQVAKAMGALSLRAAAVQVGVQADSSWGKRQRVSFAETDAGSSGSSGVGAELGAGGAGNSGGIGSSSAMDTEECPPHSATTLRSTVAEWESIQGSAVPEAAAQAAVASMLSGVCGASGRGVYAGLCPLLGPVLLATSAVVCHGAGIDIAQAQGGGGYTLLSVVPAAQVAAAGCSLEAGLRAVPASPAAVWSAVCSTAAAHSGQEGAGGGGYIATRPGRVLSSASVSSVSSALFAPNGAAMPPTPTLTSHQQQQSMPNRKKRSVSERDGLGSFSSPTGEWFPALHPHAGPFPGASVGMAARGGAAAGAGGGSMGTVGQEQAMHALVRRMHQGGAGPNVDDQDALASVAALAAAALEGLVDDEDVEFHDHSESSSTQHGGRRQSHSGLTGGGTRASSFMGSMLLPPGPSPASGSGRRSFAAAGPSTPGHGLGPGAGSGGHVPQYTGLGRSASGQGMGAGMGAGTRSHSSASLSALLRVEEAPRKGIRSSSSSSSALASLLPPAVSSAFLRTHGPMLCTLATTSLWQRTALSCGWAVLPQPLLRDHPLGTLPGRAAVLCVTHAGGDSASALPPWCPVYTAPAAAGSASPPALCTSRMWPVPAIAADCVTTVRASPDGYHALLAGEPDSSGSAHTAVPGAQGGPEGLGALGGVRARTWTSTPGQAPAEASLASLAAAQHALSPAPVPGTIVRVVSTTTGQGVLDVASAASQVNGAAWVQHGGHGPHGARGGGGQVSIAREGEGAQPLPIQHAGFVYCTRKGQVRRFAALGGSTAPTVRQ